MKVIKVKDIFNITQITSSNMSDYIWIKLQELANECDEDIEFDFEDIELERPWNNTEFRNLMKNERVHLRVYLAEIVQKTIEMMCAFANWKVGRVTNDEPISDIILQKTKVSNDIKSIYDMIKPGFKIDTDNNKVEILINDYIDQIGSRDSIEAIRLAIVDIYNEYHIPNFTVNTELMFIQINILDDIAKLIMELEELGIHIKFISDDDSIQEYVVTAINISSTRNLDTKGKLRLIREIIPKNTVGMLETYKDTRKKDNFGRMGNGQVIICRPAIYRGILRGDDKIYLVFDEYSGKDFVPKMDYMISNEGASHPGLKYKRRKISLENIGIEKKFTGAKYHFDLPIQENIDDCVITYEIEDDDIVEKKTLFPVFLKNVLDSFNIEYNKEKLNESIEETKKILSR